MFGGKYGFSLLKFTLLVLALIETFTDSVISFIVYTADTHSSSILSYYIGANYLPSKQFYKVVIVLYVPALCLWRVRKQTAVKEQDLPLSCSDCNYLKNRQLKPVAHVCQRIFRIVLHIRRVPSGVVNLSARSRSPLIWLQRLFNTWFRPNLSHEAVKKIRFNDSTISSDEESTTSGNDLIRSSGVRLSNDKRTSSRGLSWGLLVNERDGRHQEVLKEYNTRVSVSFVFQSRSMAFEAMQLHVQHCTSPQTQVCVCVWDNQVQSTVLMDVVMLLRSLHLKLHCAFESRQISGLRGALFQNTICTSIISN